MHIESQCDKTKIQLRVSNRGQEQMQIFIFCHPDPPSLCINWLVSISGSQSFNSVRSPRNHRLRVSCWQQLNYCRNRLPSIFGGRDHFRYSFFRSEKRSVNQKLSLRSPKGLRRQKNICRTCSLCSALDFFNSFWVYCEHRHQRH
jgi:hypothetical protein